MAGETGERNDDCALRGVPEREVYEELTSRQRTPTTLESHRMDFASLNPSYASPPPGGLRCPICRTSKQVISERQQQLQLVRRESRESLRRALHPDANAAFRERPA
jgi:hypothetical protein